MNKVFLSEVIEISDKGPDVSLGIVATRLG